MTNIAPALLSDSQLLEETTKAAGVERRSAAELIAFLAEVDRRKLYLGRGHSSLFVYCTKVLHLSESEAYARITAARVSRSYPVVLLHLTSGAVTLTTISLLAAHLTDENHEALLHAATHKSRRDVERIVASLIEQPDVASSVRRLPERQRAAAPGSSSLPSPVAATIGVASQSRSESNARVSFPQTRRPLVAPLGAEKYLLRVTLSAQAHTAFERARALLRHQIPNGDPAEVVERALAVLVAQLERSKHATTVRPWSNAAVASTSRHVPAAVRRAVWERDSGRCGFVGADGRCSETGFLEFHHVIPFSVGGATDVENLQLRCRAHNAYEATLFEQSSKMNSHTAGHLPSCAQPTQSQP
jgi:5-methylcytosine-specific restriction endonuclease McrA